MNEDFWFAIGLFLLMMIPVAVLGIKDTQLTKRLQKEDKDD